MKKHTKNSINKLIQSKTDSKQIIDLSYCNLSGLDLSNFDLEYVNLTGAKLQNTSLHKANLRNATLFGADLSFADLTNAYLQDTMLCGANLFKANLQSVKSIGGFNLYRANLESADLGYADLFATDLSWANLSNANLKKVNLFLATLDNANLTGANLNGTDLRSVYNFDTATIDDINLAGYDATTGDGEVIISIQLDKLNVSFTKDIIAIGLCQFHIEDLLDPYSQAICFQNIDEYGYERKCLIVSWWGKWNNLILNIRHRMHGLD